MDDFRFSPRPNRANEIAWMGWGKQAFERARSEDKPILLSISAVWCHWCHVMDETSYSDPAVIATINDRFVPVRVADRVGARGDQLLGREHRLGLADRRDQPGHLVGPADRAGRGHEPHAGPGQPAVP